jgi:hypothetical protein
MGKESVKAAQGRKNGGASGGVCFFHDVFEVLFCRLRSNLQLVGDLLIGRSFQKRLDHHDLG